MDTSGYYIDSMGDPVYFGGATADNWGTASNVDAFADGGFDWGGLLKGVAPYLAPLASVGLGTAGAIIGTNAQTDAAKQAAALAQQNQAMQLAFYQQNLDRTRADTERYRQEAQQAYAPFQQTGLEALSRLNRRTGMGAAPQGLGAAVQQGGAEFDQNPGLAGAFSGQQNPGPGVAFNYKGETNQDLGVPPQAATPSGRKSPAAQQYSDEQLKQWIVANIGTPDGQKLIQDALAKGVLYQDDIIRLGGGQQSALQGSMQAPQAPQYRPAPPATGTYGGLQQQQYGTPQYNQMVNQTDVLPPTWGGKMSIGGRPLDMPMAPNISSLQLPSQPKLVDWGGTASAIGRGPMSYGSAL